ncbi:MAG: Crp/Fnr family transcriptional regulator [Pseudolabrys sp.]|nr:Crp/Fnr family transcriptional regulator [Pseudolabrys sp.]MDP2298072.1 Crp/Fnr family transcriptional regulator [Pseudolabrys sp.]
METKKREVPLNPQAFFSKANGGRSVVTFAANQDIYRQGDPADSVFYIQTGKLKVTVTSEQGKEAIVAFLKGDEFFGEGCANGETHRSSTATALTECTITRITRSEIHRMIRANPDFAEFFISRLLDRSSHIQEDLVNQLFNSSEKRLARALLLLANFGEEGEPEPLLAKITQEELAELVGTTRSRVSFFMNKFRRMGLIEYSDRIEVRPSLLKMVLQERPEIESKVERPQ